MVLRKFPLLLSLLLVVCACAGPVTPTPWPTVLPPPTVPGERELAFETVEKEYRSSYSKPGELALVTVNSIQEIERLGDWISEQAREQLLSLDFEDYFVIAVFRGHFLDGCCAMDIQRVARRGNQVAVYVELMETTGARTQAAISPYQLVEVQRDGEPVTDVALVTWTVHRP